VVAGHLNVGAPPQTIDTFAVDLAKGSVASGASATAPASAKSPATAKAPARKRAPRAKAKAKSKPGA
jgi:hypothetical protein